MYNVTTNSSDSRNRQSAIAVFNKLSNNSNNYAKLLVYADVCQENTDNNVFETASSYDRYVRCSNSINLVSDVQISDKVSNKKHIAEFYIKTNNKIDIYCNNIMYFVIYDYLIELSHNKSVVDENTKYDDKIKKASDLKSFFKNIVLTENETVKLLEYCLDYFRQYVELDLNITNIQDVKAESSESETTTVKESKKTTTVRKKRDKKAE